VEETSARLGATLGASSSGQHKIDCIVLLGSACSKALWYPSMSCLRASCSFPKTTIENYPKEKGDALDRKGGGPSW
jgi:hypothetical protein